MSEKGLKERTEGKLLEYHLIEADEIVAIFTTIGKKSK